MTPNTTLTTFHIYPDKYDWDARWGAPPLLGEVQAPDAYSAIRIATEGGIIRPNNYSFRCQAIPAPTTI